MKLTLLLICFVMCCASVLDRAHNDYVPITGTDENGNFRVNGSGTNTQYGVLTAGHLYQPILLHEGIRGFVDKLDRDTDLMLVRFSNVKNGRVRLSTPKVGQHFILYGSAYGLNGVFTSHHVFKITDFGVLFLPPPHPGQSGAALFADDGSIIGVAKARIRVNDGDEIGLAVSSAEVKKFLRGVK